MFQGDVNESGSWGDIGSLQNPDLRPLAEEVGRILVEDNRRGLLAGTDGKGRPLAPLKSSTVRQRDGGGSQPLLPRGESSDLITKFEAQVTGGASNPTVVAGWRGVDAQALAATRSGTRHQPARDPAGIRPETLERIRQAMREHAVRLIREALGRGPGGR